MAEATHLLERVLAVVGAANAPDPPWWQELAEKFGDELLGTLAGLTVAAILALLTLARRKTIGRWWTEWRGKRRHLRAQIKAERQRELLVASMRRVWVDGYLGSALDLDAIRYLPVRLALEPDGKPAHRQPNQVDNLISVWDRSGRRKLRLTGDWGTGKCSPAVCSTALNRTSTASSAASRSPPSRSRWYSTSRTGWRRKARSINGCSTRSCAATART
jgi:hypothetical protein